MAPTKVILLACGSFNPPTYMHLRMFEIARDHLHKTGQFLVIGGCISPVHDGYAKKELAAASHRCNMVKLGLQSSDWIKISEWETLQESWTRTRNTLQHHQNELNAFLNENCDDLNAKLESLPWVPSNVTRQTVGPVVIKLLCGADLLESFATPGLWAEADIDEIVGQHGIVVITREGSSPRQFIYESDILSKYNNNIIIVNEFIRNDLSSTKIRRALRREESVKYLLTDSVIDYIYKHMLYNATRSKYLMPENNAYLSTPSPMSQTPSPVWNDKIVFDISYPVPVHSYLAIDTVDSINKKNEYKSSKPSSSSTSSSPNKFGHLPGQAVKIVTSMSGEHTTIAKEVGNQVAAKSTSTCEKVLVSSSELVDSESKDVKVKLKAAKSCNNFNAKRRKDLLKPSRSNSDVHSCDSNLIQFIFTTHGIEVISDVETVV